MATPAFLFAYSSYPQPRQWWQKQNSPQFFFAYSLRMLAMYAA